MTNPFDLTGRTAMVTGASGGIGQGIALALAAAGARVAGVARSSMEETRAQIDQQGGEFLPITADVTYFNNLPRIVEEVLDWTGRADILVNNAGIIRRADPLDFSETDWDDTINLNLKAAFFLAQAFGRHVVCRPGGGKIINIASVLAFQGGIRVPAYTATKSGLVGLTRLLACEWAAKGINVNAIAPGYVATKATEALQQDAERNAALLARIPAGRWGTPDDMGGAAVFLASAASDYCHGTILVVDGGWLAR
jgi:2-dehydro-3-deoxy-D-gluconate 5-dehydrogenase